jgi:hypothetical protein
MDLILSQHPRGFRLDNGYGEYSERNGGTIVAIFPEVGPRARRILQELKEVDGWIVSSLPCILAAVANEGLVARSRSRSPARDHRRCTRCGDSEDETEEYETICDGCLRKRDAQPPRSSLAVRSSAAEARR